MQPSLFRSFRYELDSPTWQEKAYIKAISKLTKSFIQAFIYKLIIILNYQPLSIQFSPVIETPSAARTFTITAAKQEI